MWVRHVILILTDYVLGTFWAWTAFILWAELIIASSTALHSAAPFSFVFSPCTLSSPLARKEAIATLSIGVPGARGLHLSSVSGRGHDRRPAATTEAWKMPCMHQIHDLCIVPWLEMHTHSSCPMCRHQLPTEEPPGSDGRAGDVASGNVRGGDMGNGGKRHWFSWPFNGLFWQRSGARRRRRDAMNRINKIL